MCIKGSSLGEGDLGGEVRKRRGDLGGEVRKRGEIKPPEVMKNKF